jgi:hypothetical protein
MSAATTIAQTTSDLMVLDAARPSTARLPRKYRKTQS